MSSLKYSRRLIGHTCKHYLHINMWILLSCSSVRVRSGGKCRVFIKIYSMIWKILSTRSLNLPGECISQIKFLTIGEHYMEMPTAVWSCFWQRHMRYPICTSKFQTSESKILNCNANPWIFVNSGMF
jgi:hypothetical protein